MESIHPAPAQPVLQGKARILPKISVEEISRAIRQLAPDYCGNCVNDEPQALFDSIRRSVSIAVARISPGLAHGTLLQTVREVQTGRSALERGPSFSEWLQTVGRRRLESL